MNSKEFIKKNIKFGWCPGCGLYGLFYAVTDTLAKLNKKNTVVVSGIGCSGRAAGYFNLDTIHGIHGRAIPLAVGVKRANPKLNVIVFSGDGDIIGIGGNHLLHAARRDDDITVICFVNELFAMTGGQLAPTTPKGKITITSPKGNNFQPINIQEIIASNQRYFYARSSPVFKKHLNYALKKAFLHKGFSFVEVVFPCITNYMRKTGKNIIEINKEIKSTYSISSENKFLKNDELGIINK